MSLDQLRLEGEDLQGYLQMQKGFLAVRVHNAIQQFQQDAALHGAFGTEGLECAIDAIYGVLAVQEKSLEAIGPIAEQTNQPPSDQ